MKNLFLVALFALQAVAAVWAGTPNPSNTENNNVCCTCNAPPPDSFRAVTIGGTYFELAWVPAWLGATHYLTVDEQDGNGQWTNKFIFPNIPGNTFTVTGLSSGRYYRFRIATKCGNGDPSELTSFFDDRSVIVELTLGGRVPINPVPISGVGIPYNKYEWVGFMVAHGENSNLFEVVVNGDNNPSAYIKKVFHPNNISAANFVFPIFDYPDIGHDPVANVFTPFTMAQLPIIDISHSLIGQIDYSRNQTTINIGIDNSQYIWKNEYYFSVMKADATVQIPSGDFVKGHIDINHVNVVNPVGDNVLINFQSDFRNTEACEIKIFNVDGGLEYSNSLPIQGAEIKISAETLTAGIHILQVKSSTISETFKIFKL